MDRLCVVAGFGPGMGLAIARRFAREGFAVAALSRSRNDALLSQVRAEGVEARGYAVDLADPAAAEQVLEAVIAQQGALRVLVHNAAVWNAGPPLAMPAADFARDLMLCAGSAYALARAALPHLKAQSGTLLFTGGGLALRPQFGAEVLSLVAGKSALRGLALALFDAVRPDGVHAATVTIAGTVAPGGPFDPDRIAEHYWTLHTQPREAWTAEIIHQGA